MLGNVINPLIIEAVGNQWVWKVPARVRSQLDRSPPQNVPPARSWLGSDISDMDNAKRT